MADYYDIDGVYVSEEILEKRFLCDISVCKGRCCVEGVSGAPLTDEETAILEDIFPTIEKRLTPKVVQHIKQEGKWYTNIDGDKVTMLVDDGPCAYTVKKNGVTMCAIEMAWRDGEISFQKPISCHLYPIRIDEYEGKDILSYEQIDMCKEARTNGDESGLPLYVFLKEPLIRKYGESWYNKLCDFAKD